jgi:hypothetical protein
VVLSASLVGYVLLMALTQAQHLMVMFEYPDCTCKEDYERLAAEVGLSVGRLYNYASHHGLTRVPRGQSDSQGTGVLINEITGEITPLGQF